MTKITRNPSNRDLLQSTKFHLNFARVPGVTYFCQTANLPGVSLTEIMRNTPFIDLYVPGEKMIHDTFNVTFLVDEDLRNWEQLYDWIRAMTFPREFEEYLQLGKLAQNSATRFGAKQAPQYTDASLTIYTNKNNENIRIQFKDVFPTTLGSLQFSSLDSAENIITADSTFRFSYYTINRLNKNLT